MRPILYGTKSYTKEINAQEKWIKQKSYNTPLEKHELTNDYLNHLNSLVISNYSTSYLDIDLILKKARNK